LIDRVRSWLIVNDTQIPLIGCGSPSGAFLD
jgi:hypothetical protein